MSGVSIFELCRSHIGVATIVASHCTTCPTAPKPQTPHPNLSGLSAQSIGAIASMVRAINIFKQFLDLGTRPNPGLPMMSTREDLQATLDQLYLYTENYMVSPHSCEAVRFCCPAVVVFLPNFRACCATLCLPTHPTASTFVPPPPP